LAVWRDGFVCCAGRAGAFGAGQVSGAVLCLRRGMRGGQAPRRRPTTTGVQAAQESRAPSCEERAVYCAECAASCEEREASSEKCAACCAEHAAP
jgi:hypothetical protein